MRYWESTLVESKATLSANPKSINVLLSACRWQELADYERMSTGPQLQLQGEPHASQVDLRRIKLLHVGLLADLVRDGFECSPPWFFVLLAVRGEQVLGQALCNQAYSSWTGRSMYLEDLYVRPNARRLGVARRLLQHLCQVPCRCPGKEHLVD